MPRSLRVASASVESRESFDVDAFCEDRLRQSVFDEVLDILGTLAANKGDSVCCAARDRLTVTVLGHAGNYLASGDTDAAFRLSKGIVDTLPGVAQAQDLLRKSRDLLVAKLLKQARVSHERGQWKKLTSICDRILEVVADHAEARELLVKARELHAGSILAHAQCHFEAKEYDQGIQSIRRVLVIIPNHAPAEALLRRACDQMLTQARTAMERGHLELVTSICNHVLGCDSNNVDAHDLLFKVQEAEAAGLVGAAKERLDAQQYDAAILLARQALDRIANYQPANDMIQLAHARLTSELLRDARQHSDRGAVDEALAICERVRSEYPSHALAADRVRQSICRVLVGLARSELASQAWGSALEHVEKAIKADPGNQEAADLRANIEAKRRQAEDAVREEERRLREEQIRAQWTSVARRVAAVLGLIVLCFVARGCSFARTKRALVTAVREGNRAEAVRLSTKLRKRVPAANEFLMCCEIETQFRKQYFDCDRNALQGFSRTRLAEIDRLKSEAEHREVFLPTKRQVYEKALEKLISLKSDYMAEVQKREAREKAVAEDEAREQREKATRQQAQEAVKAEAERKRTEEARDRVAADKRMSEEGASTESLQLAGERFLEREYGISYLPPRGWTRENSSDGGCVWTASGPSLLPNMNMRCARIGAASLEETAANGLRESQNSVTRLGLEWKFLNASRLRTIAGNNAIRQLVGVNASDGAFRVALYYVKGGDLLLLAVWTVPDSEWRDFEDLLDACMKSVEFMGRNEPASEAQNSVPSNHGTTIDNQLGESLAGSSERFQQEKAREYRVEWTTVPCAKCDGNGYRKGLRNADGSYSRLRCMACGGTGKIRERR